MGSHKMSRRLLHAALAIAVFAVTPWANASTGNPGDVHPGAYLGVMVDNVPPEKAAALHLKDGAGAFISGVDQDGPACHAGLKDGDIVVAYNGTPVESPDQFAGLIHGSAPGTTATMSILRDGQSKEVKVTLGDWKQMTSHMVKPPLPPPGSMAMMPPMPPRVYPDIDVAGFTQLSSRHGVVVEPLSPQLCEFFGVPANKGVLVRSVEKGSPGGNAGVRAGDVIVRVNNETVHDMADWRRALKVRSGKITLTVVRDKKEQTVDISLPANSSKLMGEDWDSLVPDSQAIAEEMQKAGAEFAKNAQEMATFAQLNQDQVDEIHRQAQAATKNAVPDISKQVEKARKQADAAMKAATPEMRKRAEEMSRQAAEIMKQTEQARKEAEKMAPELERDAIQMADSMKPSAKQMADMAREMSKTMKVMGPEFQKQMEQFKKDMEKEKLDWQQIFKGTDSSQHF